MAKGTGTGGALVNGKQLLKQQRRKNIFHRIKRDKWLYLLMLPGILLTLVFKYFPMYGAIIAFKKSGIKRQVEIKKPIKVEIEEKPVILSNAKKIFEKMKRAG